MGQCLYILITIEYLLLAEPTRNAYGTHSVSHAE